MAVAWIQHATRVGIFAGAVVGVMTAGGLVQKLASSWIKRIAHWIRSEVTEIVHEQLASVKLEVSDVKLTVKSIEDKQELTSRVQAGIVVALQEIQQNTRELTPNDGSHLHDTITDIDVNIKQLQERNKTQDG